MDLLTPVRACVSVAGLCHTPFSSVRWYDPGDTVIATPSLSGYRITPSASLGSTAAKRSAPGSPSLRHTHTRARTHRARSWLSHIQPSARRSLPHPLPSLPRPLSASERGQHQHQHHRLRAAAGLASAFYAGAPRPKSDSFRGLDRLQHLRAAHSTESD